MALSTAAAFLSIQLILQISTQVLCFPNPDLSHLHHFDAAFDLIQEESRFQPTAIVPPPAELIIREKITLPTTTVEEETQEPSYLRPVTVRNLAYTSPPPRKSSQGLKYEPKFDPKSIPKPIVAPARAHVIQISPSVKPIPIPEVFRESITTTTRPPAIVHHRRDDDSTQAFGVLENAALSLQDDDQLAVNLTGNCSADVQVVEYLEKPILKPHELEDGVIADAKKLAVVASIETFNYKNPVEFFNNQLNFNTEFTAEFPQGSEILPVLEEPENSTLAQCNETDTDTAKPAEQVEIELETSTTIQYDQPLTTLTTIEATNADIAPRSAAHAQETSSAPSSEVSTEVEATSVLPAPFPTESLNQVEAASAPSVTETVTISSSPAPSVPQVLNLSTPPTLSTDFDEATLSPSLSVKTNEQPSVYKRPAAVEPQSAEQTSLVETPAPPSSVANNSFAFGEENEQPIGGDISGEDGQVFEGTILKHGASYNIKNVAESLCLTAHKHRFLDAGILPGSVTTETFEREDNQIWDALETGPNEYWLMTQRYTVNEVTSVLTDEPVPPKNFFKIIPISSRTFIMKSTVFDKCIESVGMHKRISFVPCDITIVEQHWTAEYLYEEQKADLK